MIGGRVVETIANGDKMWVNCRDTDYDEECAVYVANTAEARAISPGDNIWWRGSDAYWTPYETTSFAHNKRVGPRDIPLERIGFSGVSRPDKAKEVA